MIGRGQRLARDCHSHALSPLVVSPCPCANRFSTVHFLGECYNQPAVPERRISLKASYCCTAGELCGSLCGTSRTSVACAAVERLALFGGRRHCVAGDPRALRLTRNVACPSSQERFRLMAA